MADFVYNTGAVEMWDGTIDLLTATIKVALIASSYVADRDDDLVDAGGADDAIDHEVDGTGYAKGWGNAGRQTLGSKAIIVDKGNDRAEFDCADVTFTGIDATPDATQLVAIEEGGADDTTSRLISHHDFAISFNGSDVVAQIADLIRLSTV